MITKMVILGTVPSCTCHLFVAEDEKISRMIILVQPIFPLCWPGAMEL